MSKASRLTLAAALAAFLAGLPLYAMAQQPPPNQPPPKKPPVQGQPNHPGAPGQPPHPGPGGAAQFHGAPGGAGPAAQFHGPGGGPGGGGQFHGAHALGERGYSFRGPGGGRRDIVTFNERERGIWIGGGWRHENHFGRFGYWWIVNGTWYYYDRPFDGPPAYVSEVEFFDEGLDPGAPVMVVQPAPVVVAPPVVVIAPRPVYVPPPVVCIGPLCVR